MTKSIYSMCLSDEVIAEIDKIAYNMGTSRSNIVDRILADFVSYQTPQMRSREVFANIEAMLSNAFQVLFEPSDTMFSLRSMLSYKYNPSVRYSLELFRSKNPIGKLKISVRSRNTAFILYFLRFFKLWSSIETAYLGERQFEIEDGKCTRLLVLQNCEEASTEAIAQAIAAYIKALDYAIKAYFEMIDEVSQPALVEKIKAIYFDYVKNNRLLV